MVPERGSPAWGRIILYYMLYVVMDIGFNLKRVINQDHKCCKYNIPLSIGCVPPWPSPIAIPPVFFIFF